MYWLMDKIDDLVDTRKKAFFVGAVVGAVAIDLVLKMGAMIGKFLGAL